MATNRYKAEYAKTARAACKYSKCRDEIHKGELRLGKTFDSDRFQIGGTETSWYHPACLFKQLKRARKSTKKIETKDDVEGFSSLAVDDKKMLLSLINGTDPDTIKPTSSDASSPKKQTKTKKSKDWIIVRSRDDESIALQSSTPLVLGRESEHLRCPDSRCSRQQILLEVSKDGKVQITQKGKNSSFLRRSDGECLIMKKGKKYTIGEGDKFTLFADVDEFELHHPLEDVSSSPTQTQTQASLDKKSSNWGDFVQKTLSTKKSSMSPAPSPKKSSSRASPKPKAKSTVKKAPTKVGKSISTEPKKKRKRKSKGSSDEEDSDEPNEYDLNDDFIDNNPVVNDDDDYNSDDYHGGTKKRRKVSDDDDDSDISEEEEDLEDVIKSGRSFAGIPATQTKICPFGKNCYRKNPEHLATHIH